MKRLISLLALFLFAAPLFAIDDPDRTDRTRRTVIVVDEVIRMSQAGVSDEAIISYVRNSREPFDVSADDLIAMTNARVSERVVKAVEDEAAARRDNYDRREGRESRSTVYVAPYPYYYDPFYSPYYYDPFWYGPRFSVGVGFVFGPRIIGHGRFHRRW